MTHRLLKGLAAAVAALLALAAVLALGLALFGWNWARGPVQDSVQQRTGRALRLAGDLSVAPGWPLAELRAQAVSFANPAWASAPQMVTAEAVALRLDLRELLRGRLAFAELRLTRPHVNLEQASGGRRSWLLDLGQTDEAAHIPIGRLLLDQGELRYIDAAQRTDLQARLATVELPAPAIAGVVARSLVFSASGQFHGQALAAEGSGGAVLALRDDATPYPLKLQATLGHTRVQAEGTVTRLLRPSAVDLQLGLQGDSLAALFPLIGIALPPTPAYRSTGRLVHSGHWWRYEAFTGVVGHSDLAGTLQVDNAAARPMLTGALASHRLSLADLGPAVGARARAVAPGAASAAAPDGRVLPDLPLSTARWPSLDADVTLRAQTLLRDKALPLDNLDLRLRLKDARLTLDPLNFGLAGGRLTALVSLDGQAQPLRGHVKAQLRGLQLGRLLPTVDLSKASIGQLNGDIELAGQGASVGRMLATADGRLSLVAQDGRISRLLMEQSGLHLLEILQLTLSGDQTVKLHCAVADFGVARGVMTARALVLDTDVNTLVGDGRIDLAQERFDLRFVPRTKVNSLVALRGPVYLRGPFDHPAVTLDTGRIAARGAGALALGLLNPLLALLPLFEAGPGVASTCATLVRDARAAPPTAGPAPGASPTPSSER